MGGASLGLGAWGSSANWQADGSSGQVGCTLLFACPTAWHGVIAQASNLPVGMRGNLVQVVRSSYC